jgi:steroid delta-isomerase-like uncharacterized protein
MTNEAEGTLHDLFAAINSHDVDKIATLFTEDCSYEDVALGSVMHGRDAVKRAYSSIFASVPDFGLDMVSLVIAGGYAASEWLMTGTSIKGKSFSTRGASISELRNSSITCNRGYYDPSRLLQALDDS